jgi:hypothetical protein
MKIRIYKYRNESKENHIKQNITTIENYNDDH